MKIVSVLFTLFLITVAGYAAQTPASTGTGDPYDGVLKGRTYTNPFFDFSLKLPRGWTSQFDVLHPSMFQPPEKIEQLKAEFREQGLLLRANPVIRVKLPGPSYGPPISRDTPYSVETRRPDIRQTRPTPILQRHRIAITGPIESLYIIAYPLANSSTTSAREVVTRDTQKLKSDAPDMEASEISETTISGQQFLRTDYIVQARDPGSKQATFSSRYVTVLRDYALVFIVIADEAKKRDRLVRIIEAVKFNPQ